MINIALIHVHNSYVDIKLKYSNDILVQCRCANTSYSWELHVQYQTLSINLKEAGNVISTWDLLHVRVLQLFYCLLCVYKPKLWLLILLTKQRTVEPDLPNLICPKMFKSNKYTDGHL